MQRKKFLQKVIVGSGGLFTMPILLQAQTGDGMKRPLTDQLPPDKVKDFVIAGHGDLVKVKTMLQELPTLLYATWDWGGGDFSNCPGRSRACGEQRNCPLPDFYRGKNKFICIDNVREN